MRLEQKDIDIIKNILLNKISDAKIFLFGSRVDDSKKGGDIDLFVKTNNNISLKEELLLLTQFELNGITRKIDLIIDTPEKNKQSFFDSIKDKAIVL